MRNLPGLLDSNPHRVALTSMSAGDGYAAVALADQPSRGKDLSAGVIRAYEPACRRSTRCLVSVMGTSGTRKRWVHDEIAHAFAFCSRGTGGGGSGGCVAGSGRRPSEAKLEVNENCVELDWPCWATHGSAVPASRVTIAPGGEIKFADNATTAATVVWTSSAPMCSGIPATATTGWEGSCKFEQEGTYRFESSTMFNVSGIANYTKYEVVVETASHRYDLNDDNHNTDDYDPTTTTPTTTTPTTTTPTTTTTTTPTATASTQPSGGGASSTAPSTATTPGSMEGPGTSHPLATLALANAQHGSTVHGTVQIPATDGGARLEIELLAQEASLAKAKRSGSSRVGRLVRPSAAAGKFSFTVSLDGAAKRALRRHHKLGLTVKIVLTPKHGEALTVTHSVVLHT